VSIKSDMMDLNRHGRHGKSTAGLEEESENRQASEKTAPR
jgi:hypothetical protein